MKFSGTIPTGGSSSYNLNMGKKNNIKTNTPATYRIVTAGGSIVEGTVLPNAPLQVTPNDDIVEFTLTVLERPDGLTAVEPK